MYLMGGSIAGRRRLKTGPSATFHRGQPYPMEGVMDVPSGTVSAHPKSMHGRRHEHQGGFRCLRSAPRHRAQDVSKTSINVHLTDQGKCHLSNLPR